MVVCVFFWLCANRSYRVNRSTHERFTLKKTINDPIFDPTVDQTYRDDSKRMPNPMRYSFVDDDDHRIRTDSSGLACEWLVDLKRQKPAFAVEHVVNS